MEKDFKRLLTENLSTSDASEILLFYRRPIGKIASELEVSARVAISETEIEEMAKTKLKEAKALKNTRLDEIESVIRTLELVEQKKKAKAITRNKRRKNRAGRRNDETVKEKIGEKERCGTKTA
jgi:hypothetical protein